MTTVQKAGFRVWMSHAYSNTVPEYRSIKQIPSVGTQLATGRTVTLTESTEEQGSGRFCSEACRQLRSLPLQRAFRNEAAFLVVGAASC